MPQEKDERPLMGLGHLAIPNTSAAQDWLERQAVKRQEAIELVAAETKKWVGDDLPDEYYAMFAERVVTALDHHL